LLFVEELADLKDMRASNLSRNLRSHQLFRQGLSKIRSIWLLA